MGFLSIVFVALAILLAILILFIKGMKSLYKKGFKKSANAIIISLLLVMLYGIYTAIYPSDSFYKEDFETDLGRPFPNHASILRKDATYPDIHGHYLACCAIEVEQKDFSDLKTKFVANFEIDSIDDFDSYNKVMRHYKKDEVLFVHRETTKKATGSYLLFFKDNRTIVFYHSLW